MNVYLSNKVVSIQRPYNSLSKLFSILFLGLLLIANFSSLHAQCPDDLDCDGISDAMENSCDMVTQTIPPDVINSSIDPVLLHDGTSTPQIINHQFPIPGCSNQFENISYQVTASSSPGSGSDILCASDNSFTAMSNAFGDFIQLEKRGSCQGGMQYRIDFLSGNESLNMSSISHGNFTAEEIIVIRSSVPIFGSSYKRADATASDMGTNGGPIITGSGTTEVKFENVSYAFGGKRNIWEVHSNGIEVPYVEIEYYRITGGASREAFTLYRNFDCDNDCDGIPNIADLDSDNDGILDEVECSSTSETIPPDAINASLDLTALHDGTNTAQVINYQFNNSGCSSSPDNIAYQVTASSSPASGSDLLCASNNSFTSLSNDYGDFIQLEKRGSCQGGMQYRIDFLSGDEMLDLSSISHGNLTADEIIIVRSSVPIFGSSYKRADVDPSDLGSNGGPIITGNGTTEVKFENVSYAFGGKRNIWEVHSGGVPVSFVEIEYYRTIGGPSREAFTLNHSLDCDNDCDGIPNYLDLDSDNDGCSDTFEAGHDDNDGDQMLGMSPVEVGATGLIINQGGYTGTNDEVTTSGEDSDGNGIADACDPVCSFPELTNVSVNDGGCDENDGSIFLSIADENLPHTFEWSHGATNEDALDLAPGSYSVTATDNTGCTTVFGPYVIADPCASIPCINRPQLVDVVINNATCGESNGSIDITVEGDGPFTYLWTAGIATTEDLINPGPGIYGVVVEDVNGCQDKFYPFEILDTNGPNLDNVSIVDGDCGAMNSAIYLSIEDVNFPHTFLWSNGSTEEDLTNVDRGEYSMILTDGTGCMTEYGPFTIGPPCDITPPFLLLNNESKADAQNLVVYPNPATNFSGITIKYFSEKMTPKLTIVNSLGIVVKTIDQHISPKWNSIDVDTQNLAKGLYFIKTNDNQLKSFIIN